MKEVKKLQELEFQVELFLEAHGQQLSDAQIADLKRIRDGVHKAAEQRRLDDLKMWAQRLILLVKEIFDHWPS